ncbi:MAG: type II toxin-antitoxin system RelE/ParE family toxin [Prevotella sp.]|nr:type II toxin-antitoxin system RelE/ParE family toxin [Prevotella sp.]
MRIVSVFAEFAGPLSANKFIERVRERGAILLKHPEVGHPENYRFIYHITKTTIWIVDIWDRRNNPARLKARVK